MFGSDAGKTYELPHTIGLYERDHGILWTRTDPSNYARDTRGRRAVHQHFFSFRLDLDIDGTANSVAETDVRHIDVPGFKNAIGPHETVLAVEGFRDADPLQARQWEVRAPSGAYAIETHDIAVPYSAPDFEPLLRAAFASHAFWVTRFRDEDLYAAGDFPNQGPAGAGLQSFISPSALLGNASDVVVWQTIGLTHVPRPEDSPVMPAETIGFKLLPHGFFAGNPALDAQELPGRRPRFRPSRP